MPYDQGQEIKLQVSVRDPDSGELFDPGTVTIKAISPVGVVTVPTVVHDALGQYHAVVVAPLGSGGAWAWRVDTTNPVGGAERAFTVNTSRFS